jgi:hypothetical protein
MESDKSGTEIAEHVPECHLDVSTPAEYRRTFNPSVRQTNCRHDMQIPIVFCPFKAATVYASFCRMPFPF